MFSSTYIPHAIYSLAITTISIHLISQKRAITEDRARVAAHLSILESVEKRLREEKDISLDDLDRLHRLARAPTSVEEKVQGDKNGIIRWKEVVFGRKSSGSEPDMSELDRRDWENMKKDLENQK